MILLHSITYQQHLLVFCVAKNQMCTEKFPGHGKEQGQMQPSSGFSAEYLATTIPLDY